MLLQQRLVVLHRGKLRHRFFRCAERGDLLRKQLGLRADEEIHLATGAHKGERRERVRHTACLPDRLVVLVVVARHELHARIFLREVVEKRRDLLARLAPRRVEVNDQLAVLLQQRLVVLHRGKLRHRYLNVLALRGAAFLRGAALREEREQLCTVR